MLKNNFWQFQTLIYPVHRTFYVNRAGVAVTEILYISNRHFWAGKASSRTFPIRFHLPATRSGSGWAASDEVNPDEEEGRGRGHFEGQMRFLTFLFTGHSLTPHFKSSNSSFFLFFRLSQLGELSQLSCSKKNTPVLPTKDKIFQPKWFSSFKWGKSHLSAN